MELDIDVPDIVSLLIAEVSPRKVNAVVRDVPECFSVCLVRRFRGS